MLKCNCEKNIGAVCDEKVVSDQWNSNQQCLPLIQRWLSHCSTLFASFHLSSELSLKDSFSVHPVAYSSLPKASF